MSTMQVCDAHRAGRHHRQPKAGLICKGSMTTSCGVKRIDWSTAQQAIDAAYALHQKGSKQKWTTDFGSYQSVVDARRGQFPDGRIPVRK